MSTTTASPQVQSGSQSALRKSSRVLKPVKHADSTQLEPPKKSPKGSEPLLKTTVKKEHKKSLTPSSPPASKRPSLIVTLKGHFHVTGALLNKKRKRTSEKQPASKVSKKRKTSDTKPKAKSESAKSEPKLRLTQDQIAEQVEQQREAQLHLPGQFTVHGTPIDLSATNPTRGFDARFLADHLRTQQEDMKQYMADNIIARKFLNKRIREVKGSIGGFEDKTKDGVLGVLQWNLGLVEGAISKYS